jgi:ATP-dependent DNA helicase PIF1
VDFEDYVPLTAAGGGHSRADWGNWAKLQLRDQNGDDAGEWIEMGRGSRFRYQREDGSIGTGYAIYVGFSDKPNHGRFYVKGIDGIKEGVYDLDAGSVDPVKFYFTEGTKFGDYLENYYKSIGRDLEDIDAKSKLPVINFSTMTPGQITEEEANRIKPENRMPPPRNLDEELKSRTEGATTASQLKEGDIVFDEALNRYGSVELVEPSPDGSGNVDVVVRWSNNQVQELTNLPADQELKVWPEGQQEEPAIDERKSKTVAKKASDLQEGDKIIVDGEEKTVVSAEDAIKVWGTDENGEEVESIYEYDQNLMDELDGGVTQVDDPIHGLIDIEVHSAITQVFTEEDEEALEYNSGESVRLSPTKPTESGKTTAAKPTQKKVSELKEGDKFVYDGENLTVVFTEDGDGISKIYTEEYGSGAPIQIESTQVVDLVIAKPEKKDSEEDAVDEPAPIGKREAAKRKKEADEKKAYEDALQNGLNRSIISVSPGDVLLGGNNTEATFISYKKNDDGSYSVTYLNANKEQKTINIKNPMVRLKVTPLAPEKRLKNVSQYDLRNLKIVNKKSELPKKKRDREPTPITGNPGSKGTLLATRKNGFFSGVTYTVSNNGRRIFIRGINKTDKFNPEQELRYRRVKAVLDSRKNLFAFYFSGAGEYLKDGAPTKKDGKTPVSVWVSELKFDAQLPTGKGPTEDLIAQEIEKLLKELEEALGIPEPVKEAVKTTDEEGFSGELNTTGNLAKTLKFTVNNDGTIKITGVVPLEDGYDELASFIESMFPDENVVFDPDSRVLTVFPDDENSDTSLRAQALNAIKKHLTSGDSASDIQDQKDEEDKKEEEEEVVLNQRYYDIYSAANEFFASSLESDEAKEFLKNRGISLETAKKLGVVFAPQSTNSLFKHLSSLGFTAEQIAQSGLGMWDTLDPDRPTVKDAFTRRLLFPFTDSEGRVIGYSGRSTNPDPKKVKNHGKYRVTKNNDVFGKKETLFNLSNAAKSVKETGQLIIVEGQFDVMAMVEAGRDNVIATSTASISKEQIELLKETFGDDLKEIVIIYDQDAAGQSGKENVGAVLKEAGYDVYEANIPQPAEGEESVDVADLQRTGGKDAIDNLILSKNKLGGLTKEQLAAVTSLLMENADIFEKEDIENYLSVIGTYSKDNADILLAKLKEKVKAYREKAETEGPLAELESLLEQAKKLGLYTEVQSLKILDKIEKSENKKEEIQKRIDEVKQKIDKKKQEDAAKAAADKAKANITKTQRNSIDRRLSLGVLTPEQQDKIRSIVDDPELTKDNLSRVIQTLNMAEHVWRMDQGWTLDPEKGIVLTLDPVLDLGVSPSEVYERMKTYKPTRDINGNPLKQESTTTTPITPKDALKALVRDIITKAYAGTDGETRDYTISEFEWLLDKHYIKDFTGLRDYIGSDISPGNILRKVELWAKFEKELLRSTAWEVDAEKAKETSIEDKDISNAISEILDTIPDWAPNESKFSLARILLQGKYNKVLETEEDLQGYYSVASRLSEKILDILGSRIVKNKLDKFNSSNKDEKAIEEILLDLTKSMENLKNRLLPVIMLDTPQATGSERNLGDNYTRAAVGLQMSMNDILNGKIAFAKKTIKKSSDSSGSETTTTPATTPATTPVTAQPGDLARKTGTRILPQTMDNNGPDGRRVYAPGGAFRGERLRREITIAYRQGGWEAVEEYLASQNLVAIDTETTGMEGYDGQLRPGNRLVQIGASRVNKNGEVEKFNIYINPETGTIMSDWSKDNLQRPVLDENGEPTGEYTPIERDWLAQQADEKEALQQFIDFVGGDAILLAHNLNFDISVIAEALERHGLSIDAMGAIDTMDLVGFMLPTYNATGKTQTGKDSQVELDGPKRVANGIKPSEADPNNPAHFQASKTLVDSLEYFTLKPSGHHRADADAYDALRVLQSVLNWVIKNPEKESTNPIGQRVLDFSKIDQSNEKSYANYMKVLGTGNPSTPKQRDVNAKGGFAEDLRKFNLSEKQISDIMQPISKMTRGQAADYIASILEDLRAGNVPDLDKALQKSKISTTPTRRSNVIPGASGSDDTLKLQEISKQARELNPGDRVRLDGDEIYGTVKSVEKVTAGFINVTIVYDDGNEEDVQMRPMAMVAVYRTVDPQDQEAFDSESTESSETPSETTDENPTGTSEGPQVATETVTEAEPAQGEPEEEEAEPAKPKVQTIDLSDYPPEQRDTIKDFVENLNKLRELKGKDDIPLIESGRPSGLVDRKELDYIDSYATKDEMYEAMIDLGIPKWKAKIMTAKLYAAKGTSKYRKELEKVNKYLRKTEQKNRNFGRLEEKVTFYEFLRRNDIQDEIGFVLSGENPFDVANRQAAREFYWAWRQSVEKRSRTTKTIKDGNISISYAADEEGHAQRLLAEAKKIATSKPIGDRKVEIKILDPDQLALLNLGKINGASLVNDDSVQIAVSSETIGRKESDGATRSDTYTLMHEYGHVYEELVLDGEDRAEFAKDITDGNVGEIFADLFAQVAYAQVTKKKLEEQVARDFKNLLKKFEERRKEKGPDLKKDGPFFAESGARPKESSSLIKGEKIIGLVEKTGQDLERFQDATKGNGGNGEWLKGTDQEAGYLPDLSNDEALLIDRYTKLVSNYNEQQAKNLPADEKQALLKRIRDILQPIVDKQRKDNRKYRVFSIPGTNVHIRFKEGSVDGKTLESVTRELTDLYEFNDMGGMPVIVTLAEENTLSLMGKFVGTLDGRIDEGYNVFNSDKTQMHVVLNLGLANKKYTPSEGDSFKDASPETWIINTLIHEYLGHGIAKVFLGQHAKGNGIHHERFKEFERQFPLSGKHPVSEYGSVSTGESFAEFVRAAYLLTKSELGTSNSEILRFANWIDSGIETAEPIQKTNGIGESLIAIDSKESKPNRFPSRMKFSGQVASIDIFNSRDAYYSNGLDPYGRPANSDFNETLQEVYAVASKARDAYYTSGSDEAFNRFSALAATVNELYNSRYFNYAKANPSQSSESVLDNILTNEDASGMRRWQSDTPFVPLRYPSTAKKFNNEFVVSEYTAKNGDVYQVAYVSSKPADASDKESESAHVFVSKPNQPLNDFIDFDTSFNDLAKKSAGQMKIQNLDQRGDARSESDLEVQGTYVNSTYRRRGLATAMLAVAKQNSRKNLRFSAQQTVQEDSWARSVDQNSENHMGLPAFVDENGDLRPAEPSPISHLSVLYQNRSPRVEEAPKINYNSAVRNKPEEEWVSLTTEDYLRKPIFDGLGSYSSSTGGGLGLNQSVVGAVDTEILSSMAGNEVDETRVLEIMEKIKSGKGFRDPVVVYYDQETKNMVVADGNHHVEAAKRLGISHVPTRVIAGRFNADEYLSPIPARTSRKPSPFKSENWPRHVNPYFIFKSEDLIQSNNESPAIDEMSRELVVKTGLGRSNLSDDISNVMGRLVLDSQTGEIYQVIDEYYEDGEPTGKVVVRKFIGQGDGLDVIRQTRKVGDSYDLRDGKKAFISRGYGSFNEEYNDRRQYVQETRNLNELTDVTDSFVEAGGQGRISTESMFFQWTQDDAVKGRINRFVSPGEVELLTLVGVDKDGRKVYDKRVVPIKELIIIPNQRETLGKEPAEHSTDMLADKIVLGELSAVTDELLNKKLISPDFAATLKRTFISRSQTLSGAEDMLESLQLLNRRGRERAKKLIEEAKVKAKAEAEAKAKSKDKKDKNEVAPTKLIEKPTYRRGRMTFGQLYQKAQYERQQGIAIDEMTRKPDETSFSENPISKPDNADLEEVLNILVELSGIPKLGYSEDEAKNLAESLNLASKSTIDEYLKVLLWQRLNKRMVLEESIAGLRVPDNMTEDQLKVLDLYSKKVESGIGTSKKVELKLTPEQAQVVSHAMNILKPGEIYKIGGQAGTGKSITLGALVKEFVRTNKNHAVIAPSAAAASNLRDAKGLTIHSFCGFEPGAVISDGFVTTIDDVDENGNPIKIQVSSQKEFIKKYSKGSYGRKLGKLEYLVIDEISMVDAHLMDLLNLALRTAKNNFDLPFGGVKLVLFGDDYQLPPVTGMSEESYLRKLEAFAKELDDGTMKEAEFVAKKDQLETERRKAEFMEINYRSYRWFNANIFAGAPIAFTELTEVLRQKDSGWSEMLARMSRGRQTDEDLAIMESRVVKNDEVLQMVLKKDQAESVNEFEVNKLKNAGAVSSSFKGEFTGNRGSFKNSELDVPENVTYYIGEKVMFIQNDNSDIREQVGIKAPPGTRRFDNGTVGTVVGFSDERGLPIVEVVKTVRNPKTGEEEEEKVQIEVGRATYHKTVGKDVTRIDPNTGKPTILMEETLSATYSQIPLVPGYAITTHKTQSKSLDSAAFLLGTDKKQEKPWESGQTYVGLSRVRTLDGVFLSRKLTHEDFIVDPEIVQFYKEIEMVTTEEKTKKEQRELERERQEAAQQQPSEPVSEEPAVDEKVGSTDKILFKNVTKADVKTAKKILEHRAKPIPNLPSDWGTRDLSDYFFSQFGYGEEESFKQNLNAIMSEKVENLHSEQKLLVSLIVAHGKADIYEHAETGTTIKRHLEDGIFSSKDASDNEVVRAANAHKLILDSGYVIDGGRMDINLRDLSYIKEKASGMYSASKDEINLDRNQMYGWNLQGRKNQMSQDDQFAYVLAHEYGHALDNKFAENGVRLSEVLENLIKSGMQNRAKEILRKYAFSSASEYFAESFAGLVLQPILNKAGYSDKTIMDEPLMNELKKQINNKNLNQNSDQPVVDEKTSSSKKDDEEEGDSNLKNWFEKINSIFTEFDETHEQWEKEESKNYGLNGNHLLSLFLKSSGFNQKPKILSEEDYNAIETDALYRGFTSEEFLDSFVDSETQFASQGIYGNGTYTSTAKDVAKLYTQAAGTPADNKILEMKLLPDANILYFNKAIDIHPKIKELASYAIQEYKKYESDLEKVQKFRDKIFAGNGYSADWTNLAIMYGIDAIRIRIPRVLSTSRTLGANDEYHTIILNRGKVAINGKSRVK